MYRAEVGCVDRAMKHQIGAEDTEFGKDIMPILTRKSSCVNARGIPTVVYQILHLMSYLGGGGYPISEQGGYPIPGWGYPSLDGVPHPWRGVPHLCQGVPIS